jgi:hypothetical protein
MGIPFKMRQGRLAFYRIRTSIVNRGAKKFLKIARRREPGRPRPCRRAFKGE